MHISSGSVSEWKKGREPHIGNLKKIADYFGVPVSALTEDSETVGAIPSPTKNPSPILTPHEAKVITAYRAHPEMQSAVDKLLGVTEDGYVTVYTAASSASNRKHTITKIPQEKWDEIENAPNTDDELL